MGQKLERRIYKIYINERPLYLVHPTSMEDMVLAPDLDFLTLTYRQTKKQLLSCIDTLEKAGRDGIYLKCQSPRETFQQFKELFLRIKACGGVVANTKNDILMIHRRGYWDLPKGKKEKNESKKECAVREVMEETGLKNVSITGKLIKTRHTYRLEDGQRVLKTNYWYGMDTSDVDLTPQAEEDILSAEWMALEQALQLTPIFKSVKDVLQAFQHFSGNH